MPADRAEPFYAALKICLLLAERDATNNGHPRATVARMRDAAAVCDRLSERRLVVLPTALEVGS